MSTMIEITTTRQSLHVAYAALCAGDKPWVAFGNFLHHFFGYYPGERQALINEPLVLPAEPTPEQRQWALFCAATAEYLSAHYGLSCPNWTQNEAYARLEEPWYHAIAAHSPRVQERLQRTTPPEFAKRNIYCGDRVFLHKYNERVA